MNAAPAQASQPIRVQKDVQAIQVPYGTPVTLRKDTDVTVVQELGGMFTIRTEHGFLVRVDGKDAEALGLEIPEAAKPPVFEGELREETIWEQLKSVYDPEIPVNIVELGLIYSCKIIPLEHGGNQVDVEMTLTAPGCGMGQVLKDDVEAKVRGIPGVTHANVELIFYPPWDPSRMSEEARLELGFM